MSSAWHSLARSFAALVSSQIIGRVITLLALVLFSYHSGPEPFALFGIYFALVGVLGVMACARYDAAIVFASDREEGWHLACLSASVCCGVSAAVLVVVLTLQSTLGPYIWGMGPNFQLLIIVSFIARATYNIASGLASREASYSSIARANIAQAIVQAGLQLGLYSSGTSPVFCLVVADIAGVVAAIAVLALAAWRGGWGNIKRVSTKVLRRRAHEWRAMPAVDVLTSFMSVAAISLPAIALPLAYPANLAGQLVMAMRLLDIPTNILTSAMTPIAQKELAAAKDKLKFVHTAVRLLSAISILCFGGIVVVVLTLSGIFSGTRWAIAIEAVPYLAAYFVGRTTSGPLVSLVNGVGAELQARAAHVTFLALTFGAIGLICVGASWRTATAALGLASIIRVAQFYLILVGSAR